MSWFLGENLTDFRNFLHGLSTAGSEPPVAMTIGNFDGVHLGHQALISHAVDWAKKHSGISVVLTFNPHPLEVLSRGNSGKKHLRIFSFADQHQQIKNLGVNALFIQKFDLEFANLSSEEFMRDFISKNFNPKYLAVGYDFSFGKNRTGTLDYLKSYCDQNSIEFSIVPALKQNGEIVSSSLVRKKVEMGQVASVRKLLGRPFYLSGEVIAGDQRGRQIGFPTANLKPEWSFFPASGVYMTQAQVGGKTYNALTNVGTNPTFKNGLEVKIETHILDFNQDIYNQDFQVHFLDRIREEKKFSNVQELVLQIKNDVDVARGYFYENP